MTSQPDDARIDAVLRQLPARLPLGEQAAHPDDRRLAEYVAGRLAEPEGSELESHLAECCDCRGLLDGLTLPVSPAMHAAAERLFPTAAPARPAFLRRAPVWAVLAAAAAMAVGIARISSGGDEVKHPDFDWSKVYAAEGLQGGGQQTREGNQPESLRFGPTSKLKWVIRASGEAKPQVVVHTGPAGGPLHRVDAKVLVGSTGTVEISGAGAALFGAEPGTKDLVVTVGASPLNLDEVAAGLSTDDAKAEVARRNGAAFQKTIVYETLAGGAP